MPIDKVCEQCHQPFRVKPKNASQRFCRFACKQVHEGTYGRPAAHKTPISFSCQECGKPFTMMQSYVTAYLKKHGKEPMYCSMPCSAIGRKKTASANNNFTCEQCGKTQPLKRGPDGNFYYEQKFCNNACKSENQRQRAFARFESGNIKKHVKRNGYVWITVPVLARTSQRNVMEHRYVMSKHLGRELYAEETVHHKDGNRQNNAIENLELFSSRHGPGQRVVDKMQFAADMVRLYPEFARAAGIMLVCDCEHCPVVPTPP